ncbi:putative quinol monooxygenase [Malaciobacter marinus]|uniref:Antibiotic biosynthesis monooxygenase n=1 Tax=Malaciobacter marinus TaxID=505249 RepID=A0A347TK62_9BACT|nr:MULTISPECIES: antibiotic biosynthesis monooxygenase family protein [Malaciobacter]AXX86990.1 putative quinol monooxygenase [Malaciobacter marinus]PHO13139.1 antibiotic biosynthesis monooxygenase [Malaciobacter marinus]PHO14249.1 antibiotic biosynthesis monooxygenase [Malaciobacter marinus]RYA23058.1 antibiotic biosynthesis monooxygenase [Malaciobacter halophilus]
MENIIVIAKIKIKPEFEKEVFNELTKLHKQTHANDSGCIKYDLHKDIEEENTYTFIETWESKEDLKIHENKSHFKEFLVNIEGKLESVQINKLEKLSI